MSAWCRCFDTYVAGENTARVMPRKPGLTVSSHIAWLITEPAEAAAAVDATVEGAATGGAATSAAGTAAATAVESAGAT